MTTPGAVTLPRVALAVSSLSAGGAERVIAELANVWAETGVPVAVLTLSATTTDHYRLHPKVQRIALDLMWESTTILQSFLSNVRRTRAIRRAVKQFAPDVVVSFIEQTNIRVIAALAGMGIPVIVSERVDPRYHRVGRSWELARRVLYPLAHRVVVQTNSVALWARGLVSARRVQVIPNFVRELPTPVDQYQRSDHAILAVGRLDRQKGFDLLLRAFAQSGLALRGVSLTILGEGPERHSLESIAMELDIAHAVSMPGIVKDPESWMARCAVFVLPSRYEGFPNALLEAMAMGCAVVAADCNSGPREIVRHGEDGLLVPPEDKNALSRALVNLMDDPALRERLSAAALAVRERFARQAIVQRWQQLIGEVLRG